MSTTASIFAATAHRPWPLPQGPWVLRQTWRDLLFAHWSVDAAAMRALVPDGMELDTFDGRAWLGVVPFRMTGVRPRALPPVPGAWRFPELNVRTYVRVNGRAGVHFFSLDAASRLAVIAARAAFFLPYYHARMEAAAEGDAVRYRSRRLAGPEAELAARFGPTGPVAPAAAGSIDAWLTERYCLYAVGPRRRIVRVDIHHPPWPLQAAFARFDRHTMAAPLGLELAPEPEHLRFSRRQDVVAWPPRVVRGPAA